MTDSNRLVSKIVINGTLETIWRELTKSDEPQAAVFNAWLHTQALVPGASLQMRTGDGRNVLVIGKVVEFEPPHRFVHTFRFTQYDDPECTVTYQLKQLDHGVEVSLIVDNLPLGSRTAKDMQGGSTMILNTLKAVVETGRPTLGTRIMYALFSKLGFMLPKRTRAEHWPL
ncbi:MAG: SRPBCC domain-containing protein [Gammaproteobacteria bacterium]|nr:SRPBCC domain-containing protein [Gammaproteobacteria bacterium]MBU1557251.1 SRPBCC domain-containing protein [Gammaproteobacteria bacterium]MBU2069956.1 SRPBCC domain-containing protein [Gammaproteobacteria bacterium]MBU2185101.1 SRPBCC domain-containing protein [Gammaproteobacteria bacterium]MBU2206969.1 SRPBCC domain-containing protein [Gammaproteobacteria bacterium]